MSAEIEVTHSCLRCHSSREYDTPADLLTILATTSRHRLYQVMTRMIPTVYRVEIDIDFFMFLYIKNNEDVHGFVLVVSRPPTPPYNRTKARFKGFIDL